MKGLGTHVLLDLYGCDSSFLDDLDFLRKTSLEGVRLSGATIVGDYFKKFQPQGVSGVVVIAESHLSFHTWPEFSYIALDYFTCGDRIDIDATLNYFEECLKPGKVVKERLARGNDLNGKNWAVPEADRAKGPTAWTTEYHWLGEDRNNPILGYKYAMDEILDRRRSEFQEILIAKNAIYGKMMFIDDFMMTTELDECAYHEMFGHVPLVLHREPRSVLIVGGGDGGLLREVLKHPAVEHVDLVELDEQVVKACKDHMPELARSFDDPKVTVYFEDGAEFVQKRTEEYDVLLVDSVDPMGPSKVLFMPQFFENCRKALKPGGIFTAQALSAWLQGDEQKAMFEALHSTWRTTLPFTSTIPTYPGAFWVFALCSDHAIEPDDFDIEKTKKITAGCRYYNTDLHKACFNLPTFLKLRLG
ncbi:MAG: polyamine aminopropyltransferase [Deltaproteobacteria bacterium]|nr:polyamine aminopropyltransferase [Deltaproteobacteria bacterium]